MTELNGPQANVHDGHGGDVTHHCHSYKETSSISADESARVLITVSVAQFRQHSVNDESGNEK